MRRRRSGDDCSNERDANQAYEMHSQERTYEVFDCLELKTGFCRYGLTQQVQAVDESRVIRPVRDNYSKRGRKQALQS